MKYRIRMNPIAPYDAPGMERWLEGLARQGYFPWEVGTALCFLERGEPRELRYRLAPNGGRRSPGADLRRELYREAGWEYICSITGFEVFATEDPGAPEPYSDSESQAAALEGLDRALRRADRFTLGLLLALAALTIFGMAVQPGYLPWMLMRMPLSIYLYLVWSLWCARRERRRVAALRETVAAGGVPQPDRPCLRQNAVTALLLAAALAALLWSGWVSRQDYTFPAEHRPCIAELEETYPCREADDSRRDTRRLGFSLLAPVQTERREYGIGDYRPPEEERFSTINGYYGPTLTTVELRVALPFLTETFVQAEMEVEHIENIDWQRQELDCPGADFAIFWQGEAHYQMLALGRGGRAVIYTYHGAEDLREHLGTMLEGLE